MRSTPWAGTSSSSCCPLPMTSAMPETSVNAYNSLMDEGMQILVGTVTTRPGSVRGAAGL